MELHPLLPNQDDLLVVLQSIDNLDSPSKMKKTCEKRKHGGQFRILRLDCCEIMEQRKDKMIKPKGGLDQIKWFYLNFITRNPSRRCNWIIICL